MCVCQPCSNWSPKLHIQVIRAIGSCLTYCRSSTTTASTVFNIGNRILYGVWII